MKRLALHIASFAVVLAAILFGAGELKPKRAQAFGTLPQGTCNVNLSCSVASLASSGAVSGTTLTLSGLLTSTVASGSAAISLVAGAYIGLNSGSVATGSLRYDGGGHVDVTGADFRTVGAGSDISSGRSVISNAASGVNAFTVVTSGARIDFGAGASDYASSDGTTVTFAGPMNGATTFSAGQTIGINGVAHLYDTSAFSLTAGGLGLRGSVANGATAKNVIIAAFPALTTAGAEMLSIYSDNAATEVAAVDKDGTFIHYGNPTLRTCAAGIEGAVSRDVLSGVATGKRTKLCLCTSDGASAYKWQNLATATLGTTTTCGTE